MATPTAQPAQSVIYYSDFQVKRNYPGQIPPDFAPFPREALTSSVAAQLDIAAARFAERVALMEPGRTLTYAALDAEMNRYAHALLELLGDAEEPAPVIMNLDDPILPPLYGALKAGKIYTALDPAEPPPRLQQLLERLEARVVITAARHLDKVKEVLRPDQALLVAEEVMALPSRPSPRLELRPDRLAAIFFTSGSTGIPKGVVRDHEHMLHHTWNNTEMGYITRHDRQALTHFPGFSSSVHGSIELLLNGGSIATLNPRSYSARDLLARLREAEITLMNPSASLLRELMSAMDEGDSLPHLRMVTIAGQPITAQDVADFQRTLGKHGAALLFVLGISEVGRATAGYSDRDTVIVDGRVPVGYVLRDREVLIVDEDGTRLGPGEIGEIVVRSRYLARGYWRDEAGTQARFRADPDEPGVRLYYTGDLGLIRPDSCVEHHGRTDFMVKIRGYRIELGAVEMAIQSHPDVAAAAAIAHPLHDGQSILAAYASLKPRAGLTVPALRAYLAERLPHYMVPARLIFLESMPMTASGKVNRRALPPPGNRRPDLATPYAPPETPLQTELAEMWAGLLQLETVGIDDDFVELGGNSLQLVRVLTMVQQRFGCAVSLRAWTAQPTVRRLAKLMVGEQDAQTTAAYDESAAAVDTQSARGDAAGPAWMWAHARPRARARTKQSLPMRALARLTGRGPILGKAKLPYGLGVALHRQWLRLPLVRKRILKQPMETFGAWQARVGLDDPQGQLLLQFLMNNSWSDWRKAHLYHPATRAQWLRESGLDTVTDIAQQGRGAVFVFCHMGTPSSVIRRLLHQRTFAEVAFLPVLAMNGGQAMALAARAAVLQAGGATLQRGGAVFIAGDGITGSGFTRPFFGLHVTFMAGPAHLATEYDAPLIPVFAHTTTDGRVVVEYMPPLRAEKQGTLEERVDDLNRRYVEVLTARWPTVLLSMRWSRLALWLGQTAPADQTEETV